MKTILCYGDSITWGYNPADGTRYQYSKTWPGVMERSLGSGYRVITEALSGRTTCWDLPYVPFQKWQRIFAHAAGIAFAIRFGYIDAWHQ